VHLKKDLGAGDITTSLLISEEDESKAIYVAKGNFILAGFPFAREVFRIIDSSIEWRLLFPEGSTVSNGEILAEISGKTRAILAGEIVSLNILQRLSGIATLTDMYVERIKGSKAKIIDTRKTTPCLRFMEKYAVRAGGGSNHRFGLFDGILIKDNHLKATGSIEEAVKRARAGHHLVKIEVEVESLDELREAIIKADIAMLDNMPVDAIREAVDIANGIVILEASGGINLGNVRDVAETGVDLISVGALTHSAQSVDISLKIVN
jgi:nicotinate-nucleotide pyrophosphorylase (carboxylating)